MESCEETEFKAVEGDDSEDEMSAYNGCCAETLAVIRNPSSAHSAQKSVLIAGDTPQKGGLQMPDRVDEQTPPSETGQNVEEPHQVSRLLMGRYDRVQMYELVWSMPENQARKAIGVGSGIIWDVYRSLHIPVPSDGYWQKKRANKPVCPRPPLLPVRIAETGLLTDVKNQPATEKGGFIDGSARECNSLSNDLVDQVKSRSVTRSAIIKPLGLPRDGLCNETTERGSSGQISPVLMARYDRETLYEEVWTLTIKQLSLRHFVSDVAIGKTCRKLHIPVPGRGY